ncbi:synaptobrevin [Penicillium brasilianum]|uniref:Synaptobrevin n=1 Tax=Penicillium brasilianum TaxID=104259 RepID=A0A1S9RAQ5_PENBI|nr:synaptobrevin [Penicillium brasilianum]
MAVSAFPSTEESPDLTLLNVARLFTRLEHNLLSPGSELRTLRKSELQRLRVAKNVDYARTLLSQLERALPQIKPLDRRHEAQAEIARDRQLLQRMQSVLDEEESGAEEDDDAEDSLDDEWKDLFSKPVAVESTQAPITEESKPAATEPTTTPMPPTTSTSASPPSSTATTIPQSTLRNRNAPPTKQTPSAPAKTTGFNTTASSSSDTTKEDALSTSRLEQEDLTTSLLSLATQLKTSTQLFQSTLENEKSVLDRAVSGIDKTSSTMEAAGQRMGMLRRMTEGKGWWGRMMLYAWIFGLWVVAVLIVFVGPKLRF